MPERKVKLTQLTFLLFILVAIIATYATAGINKYEQCTLSGTIKKKASKLFEQDQSIVNIFHGTVKRPMPIIYTGSNDTKTCFAKSSHRQDLSKMDYRYYFVLKIILRDHWFS